MTMLKDKLTEAINVKNNDVQSFVWKFARQSDGTQQELKLVDATDEQLKEFYAHCKSMLYNTDKSNPGRYTLLNLIKEQRDKCNVEIYLRKLNDGSLRADSEKYPRHLYWQDVLNCMNRNRPIFPQTKLHELPISLITGGLPKEFSNISIADVRDGCLDALGNFDNKHITFSFILKMGIYLTPNEMKEFNEKDKDGNTRSKLEVIKERLGINKSIKLIVKSSGLNFTELRAMINLRPKKYSELTTDQLITLRNKVLFRLENEVYYHIEQWEERMRQLEKVAEKRDLVLA